MNTGEDQTDERNAHRHNGNNFPAHASSNTFVSFVLSYKRPGPIENGIGGSGRLIKHDVRVLESVATYANCGSDSCPHERHQHP